MTKTDNQQVTDYRAELMARARSRFPDRNFDGKTGENGEIIEPGESLEKAIFDIFAEGDTRNKEIQELIDSDPEIRTLIMHMLRTKNARRAVASTFGDNVQDAFSEENLNKNAEDLEGWRQRKAEHDELTAKADENWERVLNEMDAWGDKQGIDDQRKADIIARLLIITAKGQSNDFTEEDFDTINKGLDYDGAVEGARQAGLVTGRNEQIEARRQSRANSAQLPPVMRGQGISVPEQREEKKKGFWAED